MEENLRTPISCNEYKPASVSIIHSKMKKNKNKKNSNKKQIKTKHEKISQEI